MISILLEDKSIENFAKAFQEIEKKSQAMMIFSASDNDFDPKEINPILESAKIPIIGGIFPAIVYKNRQYDIGTILLGLDTPLHVTQLNNISEKRDYDEVIEKEMGTLGSDTKTMFLFFDGISTNIDAIIQALFNNYGLTFNYIGGSAAKKGFLHEPILFSNQGLLKDAALLATSQAQSTIGVKHGWEPIETDTHQITKSTGNIIYEIDYKPALEVYQEIIERVTGENFSQSDFFQIAKAYPMGINRLSGDNIVRIAMGQKENALICTGDVAENSSIQVLHASHEQLIKAAEEASLLSGQYQNKNSFKLYIGCLARLLVMGEEFYKEIERIYEDEELLVGALSVGEIANTKDHYLELYNSTAVVAKINDAL